MKDLNELVPRTAKSYNVADASAMHRFLVVVSLSDNIYSN